ncbi:MULTISPECIES: SRPBCC family protein [unclassified Peribacillus]|uniref:SRPBCC family protein n=1 Tax=unclassified Peribacillus TaxID=2675266 RepID=UPI0019140F21|nr:MULTISPECIES: SRPBCC domain-containing protein [unclassified Peribacillus]MBK5446246.1 SRPBCC domain-containing protein [Peribacillus sp. TH24]MBK5459084.1 SRPBCC domain-containing protein [Peribacillus sp. TH27]MBK5502448.1 SRPBCC domain-containing protein [Peribacillus sp. TH14]
MINMLHQIMINAPAEKVYEAITTTEGFKGWWTTDAKAGPQVGSIAEFGFYNRKAIFPMHIDQLEPGKLVVWTAQHDMPGWKGTKIRFDLNVNENGVTIVDFNHSGWESMEGPYAMINTTWGSLMYILKHVEGKKPGVWHQG